MIIVIQKYVIVWASSPDGYSWKYNSTDNTTVMPITKNQTIDAGTHLVLSRQTKQTGMGVAALKLVQQNSKLFYFKVIMSSHQINILCVARLILYSKCPPARLSDLNIFFFLGNVIFSAPLQDRCLHGALTLHGPIPTNFFSSYLNLTYFQHLWDVLTL